mmetsp:Transcript_10357/g.16349  ORF Transcript_10357/g.16349 Transcript_10357/m.16349 type:complete len:198 (+) Transcript_10357:1-594(+)
MASASTQQQQQQQQRSGRKVPDGHPPNSNRQQEQQRNDDKREPPSKSFRELLEERRNANKKIGATSATIASHAIPATSNTSITTTTMSDPTPTSAPDVPNVATVRTLDELIANCAPYLTGNSRPVEYASWLRDELNITTIAELASASEDEMGVLVAGNGTVGMWQTRQFRNAVVAAAAADIGACERHPSGDGGGGYS